MTELGLLADAEVPWLLWRCNGAFKNLYLFLAPRCLANGDSVVPAEGIHGRWKRLEKQKPSLKLMLLNSLLKIHFALHEGGGIDNIDELVPYVQNARSAHKREYQMLLEHGQVPKGARQDLPERFNLNSRQAHLLRHGIGRDKPTIPITMVACRRQR